MNREPLVLQNSQIKIQERVNAKLIYWKSPIILVFARFIFAVIAQTIVAGIFLLQGHPTPWLAAAPWWIVYGSLIDIGCLGLLWRLMRQEGIHLFDLISFDRKRIWRHIAIGVGFIVLFALFFAVAGIVSGKLVYGSVQPPMPMSLLPLWGALYAIVVWPIVWAITEDMVYFGYALPRLQALSGKGWIAVLIVSFGWGIQHCALPMVDGQWALYRFIVPFILGIVWSVLYFRLRSLLPFIISHWVLNFVSVLTLVILPMFVE
jgi:membrane protease YdiL (CAAX protease family)